MTHAERIVREVSDLRDFFIQMEPVRLAVLREEARLNATALQKKPEKLRQKNAAAQPNDPPRPRFSFEAP